MRLRSFDEALRNAAKRKLPDRFYRALIRNLNEIRTAILERRALGGLESAGSKHGLDFFRLSYDALFNDMVAHAIKVLDKDSDSATFWYLYRCDPKTVDSFAKDKSYDLNTLDLMAGKLKCVRDKTHFHIDKRRVLNPKAVWNEANIIGTEFGKALEEILDILKHLYKVHFAREFLMPEYDGSDATKLIIASQRDSIVPKYVKNEVERS